MAAPKENLLSLGHLTDRERNTFTKRQKQPSLKKSVIKPVLLQDDISTLHCHQHLRSDLLQRWKELRQRELKAQQRNRQLLQQFEKAQDTLKEMLTCTAGMKTIRMEYERYLDESAPRWQRQLKEKTEAAQRKKMEEYLKSHLKNTEDQELKMSAEQPLFSQGPTIKPQKTAPPQMDYNQNGSPLPPYMQPSWQSHPRSQTARFPIRTPYQPQGSSHVPQSFLPPPILSHPFQLHHLASMPSHHHPRPRQDAPCRASPQADYVWSWPAGMPPGSEALWGQLYTEEPPPERREVQVVGEQKSRAPSSKRERGGGSKSSHLSQELDIKPVRLSSGPAESSESSRGSSGASGEKRKKRGRSRRTSSERERRSSEETSSDIIAAAVTAVQNSESDVSSEKGRKSNSRRWRSAGLAVGLPSSEEVVKERTGSNGGESSSSEDESPSAAEESRSQGAGEQISDDKSRSCREESGSQRESGSVSIKMENGGEDLSSSSEESSIGEKEEEEDEKLPREGDEENDGGEKDDSQTDEEEEQESEEEESEEDEKEKSNGMMNKENRKQGSASSQDEEVDEDDEKEDGERDEEEERESKNATDEEEETGAEEEIEEQESEEDEEEKSDRMTKSGKQGPTSTQDEEVNEESDEEEQGGDEAADPEEERDSEDSIISPPNKSKKLHVIPEEAREDEEEEAEEEEQEEGKTGSSDDDSNEISDEDIEHLLAPREQPQKRVDKELRAEEKPKAPVPICDQVEIFQADSDTSAKTDQPSDSEEFDHFYD